MSEPSSRRGTAARWGLNGFAAIALFYLFMPILWIVIYSFNKPVGKFNFIWQEFTLDNWGDPFKDEALTDALWESLKIAGISTLIATVLGTLIALALARYKFAGVGLLAFMLVLPLTTPEIVIGSSLATLFLDQDVDRGFRTVVIAHVMFQVSFVALTVRARARGFDFGLEQAAQDLGRLADADVLEGHLPAAAPRHPRRRAAGVRPVDRRLHHHAVQRRLGEHVPAVHQRQLQGVVQPAGQRAGDDDPHLLRRPARRRHALGRVQGQAQRATDERCDVGARPQRDKFAHESRLAITCLMRV